MSVNGNNASPPSPAIAPGAEEIDTAAVAQELGRRWGKSRGVDPRVPAMVPGFDAPFFQAGLAGYSDAAMRILARGGRGNHGDLVAAKLLRERRPLGLAGEHVQGERRTRDAGKNCYEKFFHVDLRTCARRARRG